MSHYQTHAWKSTLLIKTTDITYQSSNENQLNQHVSHDYVIKRSLVVVKEIGSHTYIVGYHLILI